MDVNGEYRGPDNQVHRADGFRFVSSLSLWDTYRAEQPLMTLLEPEQRTNDLVQSLLASQQESPFGILPVWQFQGLETWCMIGYHSVPIIADAYMKGIRGYDAAAALDAMVTSATYGPYGNLASYMKLGYVPVDHDDEAASKTVEYAFDDWTIARMATTMGKTSIAAAFNARATFWRNNFNAADGFVEPRLENGDWRKPFDAAKAGAGSGFTEGNAWQYSWYQPQDEQGLINLLGGDDKLIAKLDDMFDQKVRSCALCECGRHFRNDRAVHSWKRTKSSPSVSLYVCWRAFEDAGTAETDCGLAVQARSGWACGQ